MSASTILSAPEISGTALARRSVGVSSGATRSAAASFAFVICTSFDVMIGARARPAYSRTQKSCRGGEEIRSIADVAQPRHPLYAVRSDERLDRPCSILFGLAGLA